MLDDSAPVAISSQILNRQDGEDEYHVRSKAMGEGVDPRKAERAATAGCSTRRAQLGQRRATAASRWATVRRQRHDARRRRRPPVRDRERLHDARPDRRRPGQDDLPDRRRAGSADPPDQAGHAITRRAACRRASCSTAAAARSTARRARASRSSSSDQRAWLDDFWARSDVEVPGQTDVQQALRWNLFQVAQASARAEGAGIPAKGVTGSGYGGHYFWDTEIYVLPFLTYTPPRRPATPCASATPCSTPPGAAPSELAQHGRAVPVAHDQRRGGLGLLRRRHRAVPHRRRHRVRADASTSPPPATATS